MTEPEPRGGAGGSRDRVAALLDGVDALPALPPIARELMAMGDLEQADIGEVARLIELDPGLSAKVLAMCRAAHTGLGGRVGTVRHAAVMLGVDCIRRLVLSAQVCEVLREQAATLDDSGRTMGLGDDGFDRDGFWVHSVAVACASERLSRRLPGLAPPERAFVAGLLHGVGRLALELVAPRAMSRLMLLASRAGISGAEAERRVLGIDLHDAGRRLGERWGLPGDVIATMASHDDSAGAPDEHADLVGIVALAKWAARRYHLGWSGDWHDPGDGLAACARVGLSRAAVRAMIPEIVSVCGRRMGDLGFWAAVEGPPEAAMAVLIAEQANRRLAAAQGKKGRPGVTVRQMPAMGEIPAPSSR
ncbi:MAG: HDOD domain-containing protein [Phycisphaeraceae bacterium]|nr:MAG: HDOD domain-containing protein [Phycisphaeraceae bacterium]